MEKCLTNNCASVCLPAKSPATVLKCLTERSVSVSVLKPANAVKDVCWIKTPAPVSVQTFPIVKKATNLTKRVASVSVKGPYPKRCG